MYLGRWQNNLEISIIEGTTENTDAQVQRSASVLVNHVDITTAVDEFNQYSSTFNLGCNVHWRSTVVIASEIL